MEEAINIACSSMEQAEMYRKDIKKILIDLYEHEGVKCEDQTPIRGELRQGVNYYSTDIDIRKDYSSFQYLSIFVNEKAIWESWDNFYELFKAICNKLEPVYAYFGGYDDEFPTQFSFVEYYRDPYFFCVDALKNKEFFSFLKNKEFLLDMKRAREANVDRKIFVSAVSSIEKKYSINPYQSPGKSGGLFVFLNDKELQLDIDKSKKILDKKELFSLVKKHSVDSFTTPSGGVGCWKIKSEIKEGFGSEFVYPYYFVREELRRRGLKIPDGLPEKYKQALDIGLL